VEPLDLLGILISLYLGYVNDLMSINTYSHTLPLVMNSWPQIGGRHQKNIILPKTTLSIETFENNAAKTFWERILLTITDSWFFSWLDKQNKNQPQSEKLIAHKNLTKSKYSRVI
jgi:hypothetical protein